MTVLALSGWAQYAASLDNILPEDAQKIDYGDLESVEAVFRRIKASCTTSPDVAVGWSLGGQLLLRAAAAGVVQPKKLVLLAAPYQLVANDVFPQGKSSALVKMSRFALKANADAMLNQFQGQLLAQGDSNADFIREEAPKHLAPADCNAWLFWFDELMRFSCNELDFSNLPPTEIVHGCEDAVIPFANAKALKEAIPQARMHSLAECGHAPHWHDANFVKGVITAV